MARKRHSAEQIVNKLREAEVDLSEGLSVKQMCRQIGVTDQTYYKWRRAYGGLKTDDAKKPVLVTCAAGLRRRSVLRNWNNAGVEYWSGAGRVARTAPRKGRGARVHLVYLQMRHAHGRCWWHNKASARTNDERARLNNDRARTNGRRWSTNTSRWAINGRRGSAFGDRWGIIRHRCATGDGCCVMGRG